MDASTYDTTKFHHIFLGFRDQAVENEVKQAQQQF